MLSSCILCSTCLVYLTRLEYMAFKARRIYSAVQMLYE